MIALPKLARWCAGSAVGMALGLVAAHTPAGAPARPPAPGVTLQLPNSPAPALGVGDFERPIAVPALPAGRLAAAAE